VRVVHVTSDYLDARHGGIESHIYYLSRALGEAGLDSEVVRTSAEPAVHEAPGDVPFRRLSGSRGPALGRIGALAPGNYAPELVRRIAQNADARAMLDQLAPDETTIVHQHDFIASLRLTKLAARRTPVVWTNHLGEYLLLRRHRAGRLALARMTGHYRHAFAPSAELADIPTMPGRVTQMANGVDRETFAPCDAGRRADQRAELGLSPEAFVILVPRRWAPTKGVAVAVAALTRLGRLPLPVEAVFVGSALSEYPRYAAELERGISTLPFEARVIPQATAPGMAKLYGCADVTLIPSFLEATSLAALEALSVGSLVIASDTGGNPELIDDGASGFLHPPGDADALTGLVRRCALLDDREREAIREGGFAVAGRHSWQAIGDRVAEVYERVLG
jgi:glycosyltransferase involved in cell wall biosynthesis